MCARATMALHFHMLVFMPMSVRYAVPVTIPMPMPMPMPPYLRLAVLSDVPGAHTRPGGLHAVACTEKEAHSHPPPRCHRPGLRQGLFSQSFGKSKREVQEFSSPLRLSHATNDECGTAAAGVDGAPAAASQRSRAFAV